MAIEYNYPDLKEFIAGTSWARLFQTLYYVHLLRYSDRKTLQDFTGTQIATKPKMNKLVELGYLKKENNIFSSTQKTFDLLKNVGYNFNLLPAVAEGKGAEFYTQVEIAKLLKHPLCLTRKFDDLYEKAFFYPNFGYVIPDGLMILRDGSKYELNFVEVERKKPNWAEYLEDKRQKYRRLAKDEIVWKYWQIIAPFIALKCPPVNDFRFSVLCVSELKFEWRGWRFLNGNFN